MPSLKISAAIAITVAAVGFASRADAAKKCPGTQAIAVAFNEKAKNDKDPMDIVDTAVKAGSFKTLATALKAAGLVDTLKSEGPFTVFAPTDAAFAKIPKADLDAILVTQLHRVADAAAVEEHAIAAAEVHQPLT